MLYTEKFDLIIINVLYYVIQNLKSVQNLTVSVHPSQHVHRAKHSNNTARLVVSSDYLKQRKYTEQQEQHAGHRAAG